MMPANNKDPEDQINLELVTWNNEEYMEDSKNPLEELAQNLQSIGVNLSYRFENHHDRFIATDNGWKITLGRGLDIFEKIEERFSIADIDQTKMQSYGDNLFKNLTNAKPLFQHPNLQSAPKRFFSIKY